MAAKSGNLYLHADGDSFFVSCELSVRPELRGRPVVVGEDRGIAVAMNEEAKKLGVTRGMPAFRIKKMHPEVVILPHNFELYEDIASRLFQILCSYAASVEEYSIDECFALVKPSEIKYFGGAKNFMDELKHEIEKTLGVTYSLGLARTKSLAKQASKLEKPRGLVILADKKDEADALKRTAIEDVWGIGRRTVPKLERLGIRTAYDFVNHPDKEIERQFSRPVLDLKKDLAGMPVLEVESNVDPREQKTLQATATFRPASLDPRVIWGELARNAERACEHARALRLLSNRASFFVKTSEFKYRFGEIALSVFSADPGIFLDKIEPGFLKLLRRRERIRSTGVILQNLVREELAPKDLFGTQAKAQKNTDLEEAIDIIRAKYGSSAVTRAASLPKTTRRKPRS